MRTPLANDDLDAAFHTFARSAFRLELQPAYVEAVERDTVSRFLAGTPQPPIEVEAFRQYFDLIRSYVAAGKTIERVRVHNEPPTDYQRWERWAGQWNVEAGEVIDYLTRQQAHDIGLLPAAGDKDWWLLDDERLIEMAFDDEGHRINTELVTDDEAVEQARAWRHLAVRHARKENHVP